MSDKLRKILSLTLIWSGWFINAIPRWLMNYNNPDDPINNLYYKGDAISFLIIFVLSFIPGKDHRIVRASKIAVTISIIGNIVKELFFDPTHFHWSEVVFNGCAFLFLINSLFRKPKVI